MSKLFVLFAIFSALAGLVIFPYMMSGKHVQRIACIHNQELMRDALVSYQTDNAGTIPREVRMLRRYYKDGLENFAVCPATQTAYTYDPSSGQVECPNPSHRP